MAIYSQTKHLWDGRERGEDREGGNGRNEGKKLVPPTEDLGLSPSTSLAGHMILVVT